MQTRKLLNRICLTIGRKKMARTKRGVISRAKHNKVLKRVKGQYGRRKNTIRVARQAMEKAMQYAYRDRKTNKREFRSLWIQRINAGARAEGMTYGQFINGLNKSKIKLDRKVLAELAYNNPEVFKTIVKKAQSSLN
jgi:large subunit ribosomal protein L20